MGGECSLKDQMLRSISSACGLNPAAHLTRPKKYKSEHTLRRLCKRIERRVVSTGWWGSFQRRHSDVTIRSAEHLSYAHAVSSSPETIDQYYDVLEQTLVDNEL